VAEFAERCHSDAGEVSGHRSPLFADTVYH
jgi:hypothetical protein